MPSQLHRRHAHPAGAGMDQHALARGTAGKAGDGGAAVTAARPVMAEPVPPVM